MLGKLAAIVVVAGLSTSAYAQQGVEPSPPIIAWSLAKYVHQANGKLSGAWTTSYIAACSGHQPPTRDIDTALLVRLTVAGTCNGETVYLMIHRAKPIVVPDGACAFDYVTVGGMIPGIFREVTEKTAPPGSLSALRQLFPTLKHVFVTKQAGGFLALLGWSDRPPAGSSADIEKGLIEVADRAKKAGQVTYKVLSDGPWALVTVHDYEIGAEPRRDVGMDVLASRNCVFSIKFSGKKLPENSHAWPAIDTEFQRIRLVIADHEAGKPWVLSGAK